MIQPAAPKGPGAVVDIVQAIYIWSPSASTKSDFQKVKFKGQGIVIGGITRDIAGVFITGDKFYLTVSSKK